MMALFQVQKSFVTAEMIGSGLRVFLSLHCFTVTQYITTVTFLELCVL